MKISSGVTPRPLVPEEAIQASRVSNNGPSSLASPTANATSGRSLFSEKLQGFRAEALGAGLRLFSDPSVKAAVGYVKSTVANLAGSMASAFSAATGRGSQVAPGPERQRPQRSIAQDPGFGAAFDKWVQDNKFEGAKPTLAKPANEKIAQTPIVPPTAQPATAVAPQVQVHVEAPLPRTHEPPAAQPPTPVSVRTRQGPPAPALARTRQETTSPAGSPTAKLLDRKQELSESQSDLLSLMSQRLAENQSREKSSAAGDKIPARTATESVATAAANVEPQGKVYTNPAAFARALDKWERDNHFDYDNPMPAGHVSEPRPEFKSSTPLADRGAAPPSAAEAKAQRQAEIDSHQDALNAGYR